MRRLALVAPLLLALGGCGDDDGTSPFAPTHGIAGTWVKTTDGGQSWQAGVVAGAESLQFRDVQGISENVAYLLSAGTGTDSRIYKTEDGGKSWSLQFQNQDPNGFYDCFAFWTPKRGLATSDSVNGRWSGAMKDVS